MSVFFIYLGKTTEGWKTPYPPIPLCNRVKLDPWLKNWSNLLNSSKHAQDPDCASPLKNFAIAEQSSPSEQLNTIHCLPAALARSLHVSVFPVPAAP